VGTINLAATVQAQAPPVNRRRRSVLSQL